MQPYSFSFTYIMTLDPPPKEYRQQGQGQIPRGNFRGGNNMQQRGGMRGGMPNMMGGMNPMAAMMNMNPAATGFMPQMAGAAAGNFNPRGGMIPQGPRGGVMRGGMMGTFTFTSIMLCWYLIMIYLGGRGGFGAQGHVNPAFMQGPR